MCQRIGITYKMILIYVRPQLWSYKPIVSFTESDSFTQWFKWENKYPMVQIK